MREKKIRNFSTRWTDSMDNALNDLSEVMMITKQDLVRVALAEYLTNKGKLIQEYRDYLKDDTYETYQYYRLAEVKSLLVTKDKNIILGINKFIDDDGNQEEIDCNLVQIDVVIPEKKDLSEIDEILLQLKQANQVEVIELKSKLHELVHPPFEHEITLRYTKEGLMVKNDPKFKIYLEKSIEEIISKIKDRGTDI